MTPSFADRLRKRHELAMNEHKRCKQLLGEGKMSQACFDQQFRGAVAVKGGEAFIAIQKAFHQWVNENNEHQAKDITMAQS